MFCHHRKQNYLIPRKDEILEVKGETTTEAVIKGKKYKGAIVVEPKPGVHFNVSVLGLCLTVSIHHKGMELGLRDCEMFT